MRIISSAVVQCQNIYLEHLNSIIFSIIIVFCVCLKLIYRAWKSWRKNEWEKDLKVGLLTWIKRVNLDMCPSLSSTLSLNLWMNKQNNTNIFHIFISYQSCKLSFTKKLSESVTKTDCCSLLDILLYCVNMLP